MDEVKPEMQPWFSPGLRFKCTGCGQCCTGSPGYVYLSRTDLVMLSSHFSMTIEAFTKKYTRLVDNQYALLEQSGSYDCIFLKENQCTVYGSRPIQCRTFPWWLYNLRNENDWEEAGKRCEGINHPDAPLVPSPHIEEQVMIYLDNVVEENFNF